ncbi:hypothetical protein EVA_13436 [gut metagenome]|uniref:Dehydrogenase n=1 Tax=gut metagenome TaxID=749906 RepID=J9GGG8_9ZZZZ
MADNYLEKQMELYESRKAAWERQKTRKEKNDSSSKRIVSY